MKVRRIVFISLLFALWYTWPTEGETHISLDMLPKVVMADPYKRTAFRAYIRIPDHPDNKLFSFSGDCGGDALAWVRQIDFTAKSFNFELVAVMDCLFVACVHRTENGKINRYCDQRVVKARGG